MSDTHNKPDDDLRDDAEQPEAGADGEQSEDTAIPPGEEAAPGDEPAEAPEQKETVFPWEGEPPSVIAEDTARLCAKGPRPAGSLQETIAADYLRSSMEALDLEVILQRFNSPGATAWVVAAHMGAGLIAAALSWLSTTLALVLLAGVLVSFVGEWYFKINWLSGLLPVVRSQNVIGHYLPPKEAKQVVVLTSHMDSPKTGMLFSMGLARHLRDIGLAAIPAAGLAGLTLAAFVETFNGGGFLIDLLFWLSAGVVLIALMFAEQWGYGLASEGASEASGMAAVLEMARRVAKAKPRDTEYYFVAFGAHHGLLAGARHFVETFSSRISPKKALVINIDSVSAGDLRLVGQEQSLCRFSYPDPLLWSMARHLTITDKKLEGIKKGISSMPTDALPLAMAHYQAVTLAGMRSDGMPFHGGLPIDTIDRQTWQDADRSLHLIEALIKEMKP